jgi:hypothetical protein
MACETNCLRDFGDANEQNRSDSSPQRSWQCSKSSVAKALQTRTNEAFLHIQMDSFMEMLPEVYQEHPDVFAYETVYEDGKQLVIIRPDRLANELDRHRLFESPPRLSHCRLVG